MTSPHALLCSQRSLNHPLQCPQAGAVSSWVGREKPTQVQGLPVYLRREKLLLVTHASGVSRR